MHKVKGYNSTLPAAVIYSSVYTSQQAFQLVQCPPRDAHFTRDKVL